MNSKYGLPGTATAPSPAPTRGARATEPAPSPHVRPRWDALLDLRRLARWRPFLASRSVDLAGAGRGGDGTPAAWVSGRGDAIDRDSASFGLALEIERRLRHPRIAATLGTREEARCLRCLQREPGDARAPRAAATVGDVLWFAYGHHGERFRPDAICEHTGWQFATEAHRRAWERTRSRVLRAALVAAHGRALLELARAVYERFDTDEQSYRDTVHVFRVLLTNQTHNGKNSQAR